MRTLALLALIIGGCSVDGPPAPQDVERAFQVVWEGVYAMPESQRPPVTWHLSAECYDTFGNAGALHTSDGWCLAGWATPSGVDVLYLGDLGRTKLAHELYHVAYYLQQPAWLKSVNGMDAQHQTAGWQTVVPQAENLLN